MTRVLQDVLAKPEAKSQQEKHDAVHRVPYTNPNAMFLHSRRWPHSDGGLLWDPQHYHCGKHFRHTLREAKRTGMSASAGTQKFLSHHWTTPKCCACCTTKKQCIIAQSHICRACHTNRKWTHFDESQKSHFWKLATKRTVANGRTKRQRRANTPPPPPSLHIQKQNYPTDPALNWLFLTAASLATTPVH